MPYSSARSAAPVRRRLERASQECNEANSTRSPQEQLPIDALLARSWQGRRVYGLLVRKHLIGIHERYKPLFYSFESLMIVGTQRVMFVASASSCVTRVTVQSQSVFRQLLRCRFSPHVQS